ncbi:unnamed protein product [Echinostoma caproni]|uniref:Acyltransferase C-terminal domain-containing protein n=1 Tax=Echinostoma caproni TaxID=27848 RepID=A0A3P8GMS1_9TREM|nr:unnamed protein product [Echinostoma caproni]
MDVGYWYALFVIQTNEVLLYVDFTYRISSYSCCINPFCHTGWFKRRHTLHIHLRRIPMSQIPKKSEELRSWLMERFRIKDDTQFLSGVCVKPFFTEVFLCLTPVQSND